MYRATKILLCFVAATVMILPVTLWAKDKVSIAVLPFSVHSADNIDYVQQGIWDMLSSRISANEKIAVVGKEGTLEALKSVSKKDLSQAEVYDVGKKLRADYTVWGSITKIGNSVSIDGKLVDISTSKTSVSIFTQSQGMDDVITKINDFAKRIDQFVMTGASADASPASAAAASSRQGATAKEALPENRESQIVAGMRSGRRATLTGAINPEFMRGGTPLDKKGVWMSMKYPTEFRGMDIGDVNGDGLNEIVAIDNNSVYVFQKKGKDMQLLHKISGKSTERYVGVDVYSLTGNKTKDIIVSNVISGTSPNMLSAYNIIQSFVLSWKDGKFEKVADNLPWIFRVINSSGAPRLLGQQLSVSATSGGTARPFQTSINEMVWRDGRVAEGRKMRIPQGLCVYGLTLDDLGEGKEKIIALNSYDRLVVMNETDLDISKVETIMGGDERLYKSDEVFGGSNIYLPMYVDTGSGLGPVLSNVYLSPRILTYDIHKTGKREVFIARNDSPTGRVFENVKIFTSTEFYNLQWDSLGLTENWHTKKLSGYAADYQIKDVDNNGEDEIVIALVTSSGSLTNRSSVIIAYSLKGE